MTTKPAIRPRLARAHRIPRDPVAAAAYSPKEGVPMAEASIGQDFDDFLAEEGLLDSVTAAATKRVIAFQLRQAMEAKKITKQALAKLMGTSRSQLDRILDPQIKTIQLDLIVRAAHSVGRRFTITFA